MKRLESTRIYDELCAVIPGGVNSPVRAFPGLNMVPMIVNRGEGDLIFDVDGNRYIDFCCSWGALLYGHAHSTILKAVQERMAKGTSFGITTEIESKLARLVIDRVPSIEKIRFVSSGTEATMSAIRLARGATGKNGVVKFTGNFHGHADLFLVKAGSGVAHLSSEASSAGVPKETVSHVYSLTYNDVEEVRAFLRSTPSIAAVILEPVAGNMGVVPCSQDFIEMLREETQRMGALLIFDEVITGFRLGIQGAQSIYPIDPDLTCLGKIIGGGFPAAAFGGKAKFMNHLAPLGQVYQSGTLSGNPIAMEAGYQALQMCNSEEVYRQLEKKTHVITETLREMIRNSGLAIALNQVGSMFTIFFGVNQIRSWEDAQSVDVQEYARFFRFLFDHGVYAPPSPYEAWFVSTVHSDENLMYTRDLIASYIHRMKTV